MRSKINTIKQVQKHTNRYTYAHITINKLLKKDLHNTRTQTCRQRDLQRNCLLTYFKIVVAFVISMRVKYIFTKTRPYLINILIRHCMHQEVRVPVILPMAYLCIEAFSTFLVIKKLIYFPL